MEKSWWIRLVEESTKKNFHELLAEYIKESNLLEKVENIFPLQDKNFDRVKLIISRIHIELESLFNLLISKPFVSHLKDKNKYIFFQDEILSKISFEEKISILKKLKFLNKSLQEKARNINCLRNRLMHHTHKEPLYCDTNIKKDKTIILTVVKDYVDIYKHLIEVYKL